MIGTVKASIAQTTIGRFTGAVGLSYQANGSSEGGGSQEFGRDLRLGAGGFIWQPWFATYSGSAFLSLVDVSVDDGADTETTLEVGDLELQVFPVSRFPFRGFWERQDTRVDNLGLAQETSDQRQVERVGFTQNYRPRRGDYSFVGGFTQTDTDELSPSEPNTRSDRYFVRGQTGLGGDHRLSARLDLDQFETRAEPPGVVAVDRQLSVLNAEHTGSVGSGINIENFAVLTEIDDATGSVQSDTRLARVENQLDWNSVDRRTRWRSSIDYEDSSVDTSLQSSELRSLQVTESLSHRLTDTVNLSGSAAHRITEQDDVESTLSSLTGTVSYSPVAIEFNRGSYNWSTLASVSYSDPSGAESRTTVGAGLGHGVAWNQPIDRWGFTSMTLGASQNLSVNDASEGPDRGSLATTASANLQTVELDRSTVLNATFTDEHEFLDETGSFQVMNVDFQHTRTIDRFRAWNFNYSVSLTRQDDDGIQSSSEAASTTLNYRDQRVWDVIGLTFSSQLEARADSVNALSTTESGGNDRLWRNILEYRVRLGLLEFQSTLSSVLTEAAHNYSIFFAVTRSFGGSF